MNYTHLIDSCQAHLPVQYASNSFTRSDTGVVIDSEPLVCSIGCRVQAGCSAFPFYTLTKLLIRLYFKYKNVLIPKLKKFFIF